MSNSSDQKQTVSQRAKTIKQNPDSKAPEQSPSWDKINRQLKTLRNGEKINGYPFKEGFPKITPVGRRYEIIFASGEKKIATVDYSRESVSEGLQWKAGRSYENSDVAAWKEYVQ